MFASKKHDNVKIIVVNLINESYDNLLKIMGILYYIYKYKT